MPDSWGEGRETRERGKERKGDTRGNTKRERRKERSGDTGEGKDDNREW